jgi:hypothetical protein
MPREEKFGDGSGDKKLNTQTDGNKYTKSQNLQEVLMVQ